MKLTDIPSETFPIPFADSAAAGYIRQVPTASQIGITPGAASLTDGFVPLNFLPVDAGGVPPSGQDMNGILNQITQWSQWQNAGGSVIYNSAFSTAIGGYPQGAIVASASNPGILWLSIADNNTTNPDSTASANWISLLVNTGASPTIYVRTDGNDNNSGNSNTSGGALATISAAITRMKSRYYLGGAPGLIQLGNPGTYAGPGIINSLVGSISIIGDPANQGSYIISGSSAGAMIGLSGRAALGISGVTLVNNNTSAHTTFFASGATASFSNITVQAIGANTTQAHFFASSSASVGIGAGCIIATGCGFCWQATGAAIVLNSVTVTYSGGPVFAQANAFATTGGTITCQPTTVLTGAATGQRYVATLNGVINSSGQGANFFPGSVAGTTSTGGQYA